MRLFQMIRIYIQGYLALNRFQKSGSLLFFSSAVKCLEKEDNLIHRISGKRWYALQEYRHNRGGGSPYLRSSWTGCWQPMLTGPIVSQNHNNIRCQTRRAVQILFLSCSFSSVVLMIVLGNSVAQSTLFGLYYCCESCKEN